MFSIFRHTHETPLFVIEKRQRHAREAAQFRLLDRKRTLCKSASISEIIGYFSKLPRLVSG